MVLIRITRLLSILTTNRNTVTPVLPPYNIFAVLLCPITRYLRHDCKYDLFSALKCTFSAYPRDYASLSCLWILETLKRKDLIFSALRDVRILKVYWTCLICEPYTITDKSHVSRFLKTLVSLVRVPAKSSFSVIQLLFQRRTTGHLLLLSQTSNISLFSPSSVSHTRYFTCTYVMLSPDECQWLDI